MLGGAKEESECDKQWEDVVRLGLNLGLCEVFFFFSILPRGRG